ncbi:MAG: GatB/YqeY domain-containing protein [Chloroflexi bacterium]|jgi:uncharacterized protein YqeY|nr:GatB/YqeY domain-containing protein [Chloroflexota bacterium]
MAIKEQLRTDMADAMRTGDKEKRDTLRLLLAAIKQVEVDGRTTLDDADVQIILTKQAKQRRESIAEYEAAGRQEQADHEEAELDIIESYLPQMMSRQEVEEIAAQTIADLGADSPKDMGRVMGRLMPQVKGRANGSLVSDVVRDLLQI